MVDDILFSKFILNQLDSDEMARVEGLLLKNDEADAIIHSCVALYETNKELAEDMLGPDNDSSFYFDRIIDPFDSITTNKNNNAMNTIFSPSDRQQINELVQSFYNIEDKDQTLDDNLVAFYLLKCPAMTRHEAQSNIASMRKGINMFRDNLAQALTNGLESLSEKLDTIGEDLSVEGKFELYVNILALLNTLDSRNFDEEELSELKRYEDFRNELLSIRGYVTIDDLEKIKEEIIQALSTSSFSVITTIDACELLKKIESNCDLSAYSKNDTIREILITSCATHIAAKNGLLENQDYQNALPEVLAVGVAAGYEELKVIDRLNKGDINEGEAWEIIKMIGAAVGFTVLLIAATTAVALTATATFIGFLTIFGDALVVSILGGLAALAVGILLAVSIERASRWIVDKGFELIDRIVDTIRNEVFPEIKERIISFAQKVTKLVQKGVAWIKSVLTHNNFEKE